MKEYMFKVRGLEQNLDLPYMSDFAARKSALVIFTERGFVDLKISEIKLINN